MHFVGFPLKSYAVGKLTVHRNDETGDWDWPRLLQDAWDFAQLGLPFIASIIQVEEMKPELIIKLTQALESNKILGHGVGVYVGVFGQLTELKYLYDTTPTANADIQWEVFAGGLFFDRIQLKDQFVEGVSAVLDSLSNTLWCHRRRCTV